MFEKEKIISFERLTLRLSGMRMTEEYEINAENDRARLCRYTILYCDGEDQRRLEESVITDAAVVIGILNDCNIIRWDGFVGKNPPFVLDGTTFTFEAQVNGDRIIRASGSNNFPKHFGELRDFLYEQLSGKE